jgi:hypothetical protein
MVLRHSFRDFEVPSSRFVPALPLHLLAHTEVDTVIQIGSGREYISKDCQGGTITSSYDLDTPLRTFSS